MSRTPQFPVSIRLTDDVIQKLDEIAEEMGQSRSKVILGAIDRYVEMPSYQREPMADGKLRAVTKAARELEDRVKMLERVVSNMTGETVPVSEDGT